MAEPFRTQLLNLNEIVVPESHRKVDKEAVKKLAASIKEIGLQQPISVRRPVKGEYQLITGAHRLEAVRYLGEWSILASVMVVNDVDARLWEISENLHRSDLTVTERATQIAEWIRLIETKISAQIEPKLKTDSNPRGAGRQDGGVRAAARDLGIDRNEAQRALKIDSITSEAKEAAEAAGLKTQSDLLKVASYSDDDQLEAVAKIAAEKATQKAKPNAGNTRASITALADAVRRHEAAKAAKVAAKTRPKALSKAENFERYRAPYIIRVGSAAEDAFWPEEAPPPTLEILRLAEHVVEVWSQFTRKLKADPALAAPPHDLATPSSAVSMLPLREKASALELAIEKHGPVGGAVRHLRREIEEAKRWLGGGFGADGDWMEVCRILRKDLE
jgi:ParB-like chromosome segregation protein Spo0J